MSSGMSSVLHKNLLSAHLPLPDLTAFGSSARRTRSQDKSIKQLATSVLAAPKQAKPLPALKGKKVKAVDLSLSPGTKKIKQLVDTNSTPKKKYPVVETDTSIALLLSPGVKKQTNVIYMFRSKSTQKVLIGKTESTVAKRTSGYVSTFNHPETEKGKLPLPKAVQDNPEDFEFGVLCKAPGDVDLGALEAAFIDKKEALTHGFNQRKGGGGGRKRKKTAATAKKTEEAKVKIFKSFVSPKKKPIVKTKKGLQVQLSPNSKKTKNVIYVFKNNVTGERYVGKTIRELNKRMSEHMHFAKRKDKENGKKELYQDIRRFPDKFSVGILYKAPSEDIDLDVIERAFIAHYDSVKEGYNKNAGGGGG